MPRNGRMTEAELAAALRRCAREQGWMEHVVYDSRRSPSGWPDLVFARGLHLVVWEAKADKGRPTAEQIAWLDWWAAFAEDVNDMAQGMEDSCGCIHGRMRDDYSRVHVALVRPADLEAAYWLLMGQRPSEEHPWPEEWPRRAGERVA